MWPGGLLDWLLLQADYSSKLTLQCEQEDYLTDYSSKLRRDYGEMEGEGPPLHQEAWQVIAIWVSWYEYLDLDCADYDDVDDNDNNAMIKSGKNWKTVVAGSVR